MERAKPPEEPSYYRRAGELRRETLWSRGWRLWKQAFHSWQFWTGEVAAVGGAAMLASDVAPWVQALATIGAAVGLGLAVYAACLLIAPYLWRRDAKRLLPPFNDLYDRTAQRLLSHELGKQDPAEQGVGTAFDALYRLHSRFAIGLTAKACALRLSQIYGDGSAPDDQEIDLVKDDFLAELVILHLIERRGKRFFLTTFGKNFLEQHVLYIDHELGHDGELRIRDWNTSLPSNPLEQ